MRARPWSVAMPPRPLIAVLLLAACAAPEGDETLTFLLRADQPNVEHVSGQLTELVASQLRDSGALDDGYPLLGRIEFEPSPAGTGQDMRCATAQPHPSTPDCILLNASGDFVRTQTITWQSAAFYMYRLYVLPVGRADVDPTRDFVAMDVFLQQEHGLWDAVDRAIRRSAVALGARPFRP